MNEKKGIVKTAELAEPIEGVEIRCTDEDGVVIIQAATDEEGNWSIRDVPATATVHFEKEGFVSKPFSPEDLPETVRLLEDRLIGYQDRLWFHPGEEVTARIHAPASYDATLFRHGLEKKAVARFPDNPPNTQQVPDEIFVEDGLEWDSSLTYRIPETAEPGLYSLLLESKGQRDFAVPFVVSTPKDAYDRSDVLVLASTNNWISYNVWGGRNRYRNFEDGLSEPYLWDPSFFTELLARAGKMAPRRLVRAVKRIVGMPPSDPEWKFKRLGIKRPFTNCALEADHVMHPFTNHLAAGEWRVLAWLEREQVPYDILSCFELHHNPEILRDYKAIVLSTHCEYWSREMYYALKKYHLENSLSILNLSGNSIYREVEFFDDGSHRCVSLKFSESVEDETQLIGVRFTEGDFATAAPYKILEPEHWLFQDLDTDGWRYFGQKSLNRRLPGRTDRYDPGKPGVKSGLQGEGASGWETDKLSPTAPGDFVKVAKGQNPWGGADMVVREAEGNRGGVFSASSITFGGALLIDDFCSGLTKNALNRFLS